MKERRKLHQRIHFGNQFTLEPGTVVSVRKMKPLPYWFLKLFSVLTIQMQRSKDPNAVIKVHQSYRFCLRCYFHHLLFYGIVPKGKTLCLAKSSYTHKTQYPHSHVVAHCRVKYNTVLNLLYSGKSDNDGFFSRMTKRSTYKLLSLTAGCTFPFCLLPPPLISPVAAHVDVFTGGNLKRISYTLSNWCCLLCVNERCVLASTSIGHKTI